MAMTKREPHSTTTNELTEQVGEEDDSEKSQRDFEDAFRSALQKIRRLIELAPVGAARNHRGGRQAFLLPGKSGAPSEPDRILIHNLAVICASPRAVEPAKEAGAWLESNSIHLDRLRALPEADLWRAVGTIADDPGCPPPAEDHHGRRASGTSR